MEFHKQKNLRDLEYHTLLNYFNLLALFIGTTYVTIVIGTVNVIEWTISKLISTAIFIFLFIILIWLLFYSRLKSIRKEIENL